MLEGVGGLADDVALFDGLGGIEGSGLDQLIVAEYAQLGDLVTRKDGRQQRSGIVYLGIEALARAAWQIEGHFALSDEAVSRHLEGATVRKVIVVKDRIVNIVAG